VIEPALAVTAFLLTLMLHASALLGAVWLLERGGALRHPRWAELAWRGALFGALLSASAASLPPWPRAALPAAGVAPAWTAPRAATRDAATARATVEPLEALEPIVPRGVRGLRGLRAFEPARSSDPAPAAASERGAAWPTRIALAPLQVTLLAQGWLALSLAWLGLTLARSLRLRRLLQRAWRAPRAGTQQQAQAAELAAALQLPPLRLHLDASLTSPVALPRHTVLLPPWSTRLPERESRALLAHEIAHLARRDPAWRIAQHFVLAPLCLHPLAWLALRRLDALAEQQADATAARLLGDGRPLAECLARCLAQQSVSHRPAPRFALAMAERPGAVVDRVQRLLEEDPMENLPPSPRRTRLALVFGLLAALSLPTIAVTAIADGETQSVSVHRDDGGREKVDITIRKGDYALEVEMEGRVVFAPDESDVLSMEPDAELSIEETRDGVTHAIEFTPAGASVTREYQRDGKDAPFDAAARAWLAAALPEMFRRTAIDAEARAQRFLQRGGPDALLAEIGLIHGDYGRGRYLGLLFKHASLDAAQLAQALKLAGGIESDYELRQTLSRALASQKLAPAQQREVLALAGELDSDYERAELLIEAGERFALDGSSLALWRGLLDGMGSDYEKRRTVEALLKRDFGGTGAAELAFEVAAGIGSDYEKRQLLEAGLRRARGDASLRLAYLEVAATLGSDFERKQALLALLKAGEVDGAVALATLDAIDGIGSGHERKESLLALARVMPVEDAVVQRFRAVARQLGSYERGVVEQALDKLVVAR
jgi:beta-lactamase regulating signal transducer with metallopeptidase domain